MDSSERAAALITRLNDRSEAANAPVISQQLQELQLSSDGWTIADNLLSVQDTNLRFYGALTFQIKLNRDAARLGPDDSQALLERLINHLVTCVNDSSQIYIIEKLCSVLATYLTQATCQWSEPLAQIVCQFARNESPQNLSGIGHAVSLLSKAHFRAILRLSRILVEDLGRFQGDDIRNHQIEEVVKGSVPIFATLFNRALQIEQGSGILSEDALSAFTAWFKYSSSRFLVDLDTWNLFRDMLDTIIQCLYNINFSIVAIAADALADVLELHAHCLSDKQMEQIWPAVNHALEATLDQSSEERLPLLRLVVAWGKYMVPDIVKSPDSPNFRSLTANLTSQLFDIDWAEDGCEQLYLILDFWTDLADYLFESPPPDADGSHWQAIEAMLQPMIQALLDTLDRKDDQTMAEADPDYVEDWQRLRQDFAGILVKFMGTGYIPVYSMCADQIEQGLERNDWIRVESIIQILSDMADEWEPSTAAEEALSRIFQSRIFQLVSDQASLESTSVRLKRTIVRFVDNYSFFFHHEPAQIPVIMTLLMTLMEQSLSAAPKLGDYCAKCIASICSSCRRRLVVMLSDLMNFCIQVLANPSLSTYQREKVYSGIAYVLQALPRESDKIQPLRALIAQLHSDAQAARGLLEAGDTEGGEQGIFTVFQCLAAAGKAFHNRPRQVILDDDDGSRSVEDHSTSPWRSPEGSAIPQTILDMLKLVYLVPWSGDARGAACAVFNVGLTESVPGPFIFPSGVISSFLSDIDLSTPRLESIITTACGFVSASSRSNAVRCPEDVAKLLNAITAVLLALPSPVHDPALAQLIIDFLNRLINKYSDVLFSNSALPDVLRFCLSALVSDAPMLKRSTAGFVGELLTLPQELARNEPPIPGLADYAQSVVDDLLPHVATAIVHQVGGNAQRSELEAISRVLRAFIVASPKSKGLLDMALSTSSFPAEAKVDAKGKRMFVGKIATLRGGKGTTEAVKAFWAECRGTVGSY
ncbi:hypothetical protein CAC42_861 [Sphaceloma murrayae]|uniref:Importin N-terminal domain-containing protein n=1 Tax=Sphaceloma murrayae TaxID=2082308 RepID=A0A2K1QKY8_9PEZI|nr:hypothetical protein CAC42_861 [Sphaceloma murrayae]